MVVANVEMRFLWLALATAILVGTVMVMQRHRHSDIVLEAPEQESHQECAQSCCPDFRG